VISTESYGGIAVVRLNRPQRRNALIPELVEGLVQHLTAAAASRRPIVLTAPGPSFCAGAELKWLASCRDPAHGVAELVAVHHLAITTLLEMPVPVIAAINGNVAGGGIGLAMAADYRIAARGSSFTAAYFRLGLTPDGGASAFLERTIGSARTLELLLTNRRLGAEEARDWGMVNEVVDDEQLLDRAVEFAAGLAPVASYALLETRRLLDTVNIRNQLQRESVAIRTTALGAWFREALQAFIEAHPD
jgi:2-(1,2-epoxy-1,2-dihydrophenyl)acetyl-CoA isomerase